MEYFVLRVELITCEAAVSLGERANRASAITARSLLALPPKEQPLRRLLNLFFWL